MAQEMQADMERQRAEENERLRRLAAEELSAMRIELTRALEDRVELHQDLNLLAERLSVQENLTMKARDETRLALEEARVEAHRLQTASDEAAGTIQRQAAHIARLKKQMARPTRLLAKKILRRTPKQSGSSNAN